MAEAGSHIDNTSISATDNDCVMQVSGQAAASTPPPPPPPQAQPVQQPPQAQPPVQALGQPPLQPVPTKPARTWPIGPANLVLIGLFAAGILCLYVLSVRNGPANASAAEQVVEAQVDAALMQMDATSGGKGPIDETSSVVDTFYYEASQRQVPIEQIAGNAFVYAPAAGAQERHAPDGEPNATADRGADAAMQVVQGLQLQSVLMGSAGATAMISGNVLTEGNAVKGWTVKKIGPTEVLLVRQDKSYVLRMAR